ncbi:MAG: hypothetical protein Terrestrivirus1_8 [Terrestrivirus sp.]|uniref:Mitochondrial carrier protein n=1 Tax=Terrestrivirus sp. TaxID=2487775 RepID=A0A3G4ZL62_9VIRU|nr:MAG: hypothetical protein Terrestrivirus1_8 [Terrestrivirus sp.]
MNNDIHKKFISGLGAGVINTVLFNPVDKAIYLMIRDNKSLFDSSVWKNPYRGVSQAFYGRVMGYGIYFTLFDVYRENFNMSVLASSIGTGCTTAVLTSPINVIKMFNWNQDTNNKKLRILGMEMYKKYGYSVFFKGLECTMLRDSLFSSIFYGLSTKYNEEKNMVKDICFGTIGTIVASPINYARNEKYFNFDKKITVIDVTKELFTDIKNGNIKNLIFHKLNIGWGTLRVGVGMALSKQIYETILAKV